MPGPKPLRLYEEVLLLSLRNDKGTIAGGVMFEPAAGGAILAELILENRVRALAEGRSTQAIVQDSAPLNDGRIGADREPAPDPLLRRNSRIMSGNFQA